MCYITRKKCYKNFFKECNNGPPVITYTLYTLSFQDVIHTARTVNIFYFGYLQHFHFAVPKSILQLIFEQNILEGM